MLLSRGRSGRNPQDRSQKWARLPCVQQSEAISEATTLKRRRLTHAQGPDALGPERNSRATACWMLSAACRCAGWTEKRSVRGTCTGWKNRGLRDV